MVKQTEYQLKYRNKFIVDGAKLSKARMAAKLSMDEVAEDLGCNKSSVSRWEQGKLQPSEKRIRRMVDLYGTSDFVRANSQNKHLGKEFLVEGK